MVDPVGLLRDRTQEAIALFRRMESDLELSAAFAAAAEAIILSLASGGRVLLCGNGGSAADAQHLAAELVGRFQLEREPWAAICLSDNVAGVTAIANDYGYEDVFVRGVKAFGRRGDVLLGLSTSGRSTNVVAALQVGRQLGLTTVAFIGGGGSPMSEVADISIRVDGPSTARIQEGHKLVGHTLFEAVEMALAADGDMSTPAEGV